MIIEWTKGIKNRMNSWLPLLLVACAGMSLLLFQNQKDGFETGHHGFLSSHGMTLAKNLIMGDQPLFMFMEERVEDGVRSYSPYNRFPVFPFFLLGLAIYPFEPHLALQIYVGRQVMNLFFFLAIIVMFKLLGELVKDKFLALSITLLSFSSYTMLFYKDMIFNDIPALFGFMLALYGVVLAQKIKLKAWQIAFFSLVPVAMGWQPYSILVVWFLVDFVVLAMMTRTPSIRERMMTFMKQPSFRITILAVLWGSLILGLQLLNEWRVVGGSFATVSSLRSMFWRLGLANPETYLPYQAQLRWDNFLVDQAGRFVRMLIPFGGFLDLKLSEYLSTVALVFIAAIVMISSSKYFKDWGITYKIPVVFVFSGLLWALLMRDFVAFHDFQSIFYIGFVAMWYMILSFHIHPRILKTAAIVVFLLFIMSVYRMSVEQGAISQVVNEVTSEFQNIYDKLPENSRIYVDGNRQQIGIGFHAVDFYLAGSYSTTLEEADYGVSLNSGFNGERLTFNTRVNLFRIIRP
jgi:hypothetical protein